MLQRWLSFPPLAWIAARFHRLFVLGRCLQGLVFQSRVFQGLVLGVVLLLLLAVPSPAFAQVFSQGMSLPVVGSIHTYNERPGQTTFRSKQSFRDRSDRSWQVILFKRYQGDELQGLYLRLIGFPGLVALDTQKSLTIATGSSAQWQAEPALDPQTQVLPENVNQYDVAAAITDLAGDIPLQVDIPLAGGSTAQLVLPPFAVHEWRDLNALTP